MAKLKAPAGEGSESARLMSMAPEMAKGIADFSGAAYAHSMRVAQINQCPV